MLKAVLALGFVFLGGCAGSIGPPQRAEDDSVRASETSNAHLPRTAVDQSRLQGLPAAPVCAGVVFAPDSSSLDHPDIVMSFGDQALDSKVHAQVLDTMRADELEPLASAFAAAREELRLCIPKGQVDATFSVQGGRVSVVSTRLTDAATLECTRKAVSPFALTLNVRSARVLLTRLGPEQLGPLPEPLSKEEVLRVIRSHTDEVLACYQEEVLALGLARELSVPVDIGINGEGRVFFARPQELSDALTEFSCCLQRVISAWTFPPPGPGIVAIRYPFNFEP